MGFAIEEHFPLYIYHKNDPILFFAHSMTLDIFPVVLTSFSTANSYDAHRPSHSPTAVSALLKHLIIENKLHARIVDLAAATGKLQSFRRRERRSMRF